MLPSPSGSPHMGHVLVYTIGDVIARFRSRNGSTVLHPIGFDSFRLPADNAAIREGGPPREIIQRTIANITPEMKRMGWPLHCDRVIAAPAPTNYPSTHSLFLKLYQAS